MFYFCVVVPRLMLNLKNQLTNHKRSKVVNFFGRYGKTLHKCRKTQSKIKLYNLIIILSSLSYSCMVGIGDELNPRIVSGILLTSDLWWKSTLNYRNFLFYLVTTLIKGIKRITLDTSRSPQPVKGLGTKMVFDTSRNTEVELLNVYIRKRPKVFVFELTV